MASSIFTRISLVGLLVGLLSVPVLATAAEYEAVLEWKQRVELSTFVTGVVAKVEVMPGDAVKKNDLLIALDDTLLKANLEKANADVVRWQRRHKEAERELERNNELFDRTVLSEHELEVANIAMVEATANFQSAKAAKAQAVSAFNNSQIRAPFDGVVIQQNVSVGQTIVSNQTAKVLAVVAASGGMVANTLLAYDVIKGLKLGQSATVVVDGSRFTGKIVSMGFEPVSSTDKRYSVLIEFGTKAKVMRAGQKATVKIP